MTAIAHEVTSELGYDLVRDYDDTILALLEGPLPREDVLDRLGSLAVLDRMLKHGLLATEDGKVRTVSAVYHQVRQEGMMSFLERYVLPSLSAGLDEAGRATLQTRYLTLDQPTMAGLRSGPVQRLFDRFTQITEQPRSIGSSRLTVMVFGTSRVLASIPDLDEQALVHLKHTALQRSDEADRSDAVLTQMYFLADHGRHSAVMDAVTDFLAQFDGERAGPNEEPTYHLTVASHWRSATPGTRGSPIQ